MNGFCRGLQSWTQRERQWVQCVFAHVAVCVYVWVCVCALLCASSQALMGLIEGAGSGRETGILCHSCAYLQAIKAESRRHNKLTSIHRTAHMQRHSYCIYTHETEMSTERRPKQYIYLKAHWGLQRGIQAQIHTVWLYHWIHRASCCKNTMSLCPHLF